MYILYYDRGTNSVAQWYVPPGTPLDQAASTLGIIEASLDQFPGYKFSPNSPVPPGGSVGPPPSQFAEVKWGAAGTWITISPDGLDATVNAAAWTSVRGDVGHSTGLWYWEDEVIKDGGSGTFGAGVADATTPAGTGMDTTGCPKNGSVESGGFYFNTPPFTNTQGIVGLGPLPLGARIGVAVDFDTQELWMSNNGVWVAGGDPVAKVAPLITWHNNPLELFPYAVMYSGSTARIHTGDTLTFGPPTGYSAWGKL